MKPIRTLISLFIISGSSLAVAQQDSIEWYPGYWTNIWKPAYWENMQLALPNIRPNDSLDIHAVLMSLFPGRPVAAEYNYSDADVVTWDCPECPKSTFDMSAFEDDSLPANDDDVFPFTFNFTQVIGSIAFKNRQQEEFRLISFSTGPDYPASSRYSHGVLGLALFQRQGKQWTLRVFNPAVDANGSWMRADPPDTLIQLEQGNLSLARGQYPCGPPLEDYWPCFKYAYCYGLVDNRLVPVLKIDDTDCFNVGLAPGSYWNSDLQIAQGPIAFPDIILRRQGRMELKKEPSVEDMVSGLLPELKPYIQQGRSFDFTLEKRFTFSGNGYGVKDHTVKVRF